MPLEMDLHPDNHSHHLDQQHQHQHPHPPTPPLPTHKPLAEEDEGAKPRPLPLSLHNGTLKKPRQQPLPPLLWSRPHRHEGHGKHFVYRECMKNHAAPLGGHALDGCGEFLPSLGSNPSEPASLTCAACGCHRNFHHRLLHGVGREDGLEEEDGDEEDHNSSPPLPRQAAAFNRYCSSAPHMLITLSARHHGGPVGPSGSPPVTAGTTFAAKGGGETTPVVLGSALPAKRFRTKFSPEQKARMQELCERLGWRMQRRDEAMVEESCREMGVSRGVFKVWMHNNKHTFVGGWSARRGGGGRAGGDGGGGGGGGGTRETTSCSGGGAGAGAGGGDACVNGDGGNGGSTGHAVNSSLVSS